MAPGRSDAGQGMDCRLLHHQPGPAGPLLHLSWRRRQGLSRGWRPAVRQQVSHRRSGLCRQSLQHIIEIRIGLQPVEPSGVQQAHDGRSPLARMQAAGEQPVLASQGDGADQVFNAIVVRSQVAVVDEARQRRPPFEAVVDGLGGRAAVGQLLPVGHQPGMQQIGGRPALELADAQPLLPVQVLDLTLDVVEDAEQLQGLLGQGAAVVGPQLVEFTAGMRQAARLGHPRHSWPACSPRSRRR